MKILDRKLNLVFIVGCCALTNSSVACADEIKSACDQTILGHPGCAVGDFGAHPAAIHRLPVEQVLDNERLQLPDNVVMLRARHKAKQRTDSTQNGDRDIKGVPQKEPPKSLHQS